jgi:hypothetical protein
MRKENDPIHSELEKSSALTVEDSKKLILSECES